MRAAIPDAALADCERAIGLTEPHPGFRDRIADAILFSLLARVVAPKRDRTQKANYLTLADCAEAAATALDKLQMGAPKGAHTQREAAATALHELRTVLGRAVPRLQPIGKDEVSPLDALSPDTPDQLRDLAQIARSSAADVAPDKGGAERVFWLDMLLYVLADAYAHAAARPASVTTSEDHGKYGGRYMDLVGVVLPIMAEIAGDPDIVRRTNTAFGLGKRAQRALKQLDQTAAERQK